MYVCVEQTQQQARVFLARRRAKRAARHRRFAEVVREERERELMLVEDIEAQDRRNYERAAAIMNRLMRGLLGRVRYLRAKAKRARELGVELNVKAREAALVNMERVRVERERNAAIMRRAIMALQRVFRGFKARQRVEQLKHEKRKAELATVIQSVYRKLLAERQAAAMRRYQANIKHVQRSRRVSGAILRLLRYPDRTSQRRFVDMLWRMGLDPRDYQLDMGKQWEEMRVDAAVALRELRFEMAIWKHGRLNTYARRLYREQHAKEYLPVVVIENRDPVRVVHRCR